ncbi:MULTISPECIES: hypothetical protein, partial [unclassified Microcoleus]|uniref:hypothetical protein n=1 Tax=unclassified Microcoleus TaxID=2642155 RepID=UPI002FD279BF
GIFESDAPYRYCCINFDNWCKICQKETWSQTNNPNIFGFVCARLAAMVRRYQIVDFFREFLKATHPTGIAV